MFAWNKGELGCCTIGEHSIDTQGFPPCKASPGRLSYWEEAEVKRQIDALVDLGKMRPNNFEYVAFVWDVGCEQAYHALKAALVDALVFTRPDFKRTFWLDVDWSTKGVGSILSQREGKFEKVIAYASKSLTEA